MAGETTTPVSRTERITILLNEYNTLRDEMTARTVAGYQLVGVGATLLVAWITAWRARPYNALLVHVLLAAWLGTVLIGGVFAVFVLLPPNEHIVQLEDKINKLAGETLLTWQSSIRFPGVPQGFSYFASVRRIMSRRNPWSAP